MGRYSYSVMEPVRYDSNTQQTSDPLPASIDHSADHYEVPGDRQQILKTSSQQRSNRPWFIAVLVLIVCAGVLLIVVVWQAKRHQNSRTPDEVPEEEDSCEPNPCGPGMCVPLVTGYSCQCPSNSPGLRCEPAFRDCQALLNAGYNSSGVYNIFLDQPHPSKTVLCEMTPSGEGWTHVLRRKNGDIDFDRSWSEYKQGFGDLKGDFWIGNEALHQLTQRSEHQYKLQVTVTYFHDMRKQNFSYLNFSVSDESSNYTLSFINSPLNTTDGLGPFLGQPFSTYDGDHDRSPRNCAADLLGGWWYTDCVSFGGKLTGLLYNQPYNKAPTGTFWGAWGNKNSVVFAEMKIKPDTSQKPPNTHPELGKA